MRSTEFIFDFYLEDFNQSNETWAFEIIFNDQDYEVLFDLCEVDEYLDFWSEMEIYGVHDFSTEGDDQLFGYNTYEVKPKNISSVMDRWRNYFIGLGYECGSLVKK